MFYYIFLQKNVDAILPGVMVSWFMPGLSSKGIILVGLPKLPVDFRDKKKLNYYLILVFNAQLYWSHLCLNLNGGNSVQM